MSLLDINHLNTMIGENVAENTYNVRHINVVIMSKQFFLYIPCLTVA